MYIFLVFNKNDIKKFTHENDIARGNLLYMWRFKAPVLYLPEYSIYTHQSNYFNGGKLCNVPPYALWSMALSQKPMKNNDS